MSLAHDAVALAIAGFLPAGLFRLQVLCRCVRRRLQSADVWLLAFRCMKLSSCDLSGSGGMQSLAGRGKQKRGELGQVGFLFRSSLGFSVGCVQNWGVSSMSFLSGFSNPPKSFHVGARPYHCLARWPRCQRSWSRWSCGSGGSALEILLCSPGSKFVDFHLPFSFETTWNE